jgi:hypothetical protein
MVIKMLLNSVIQKKIQMILKGNKCNHLHYWKINK